MIALVLSRLLLIALPFGVYFLWREIARRRGRPMGETPWAWLLTAGIMLGALSLMASVLFQDDHRRSVYSPAEAGPGGAVRPGRFE